MATILVIEDEQNVRENILETLELGGFDALGACDGYQGIDLARQIAPDCVVCDIMMDGIDGFGVLQTLRGEKTGVNDRLPFIFVTALSDNDTLQQARDMGADGYLVKPFVADDLLDAVSMQLQYRSKPPTEGDRAFAAARNRILDQAAARVGRSLDRVNSVRELLSRRLHGLEPCELALLGRDITGDDTCERTVTQAHLVAQVALLARLDTGAYDRSARTGDRLPLRELWMAALDQARAMVPPRPDVDVHLDLNAAQQTDLPPVVGDASMLRHALAEIAANALTHTPVNGSMTLALSQAGDGVWFSVTDTGSGMDPITLLAAHGELAPEYDGLGLHLVRRIVQTYGGELAIQSNLALGTVAALWMPLAQ